MVLCWVYICFFQYSVKGYNIQMLKRQQINVDYKISPYYGHKISQIINDSKISFDQFQTPGWSSIVQTQRSQENKQKQKESIHSKILQKLNQLDDNLKQSQFSNMAKSNLEENNQNKNLSKKMDKKDGENKRINMQGKQQSMSEPNSRQSRVLQQKFKKNGDRSSIRSQKKIKTLQSMNYSNLSQRQNKPGMIVKNKHSESVNKFNKPSSRFNHISVHEHLYLDGKKLQKKKIMETIFQEEYQKKTTMPFKPKINAKSHILAQIKYSRVKQKEEFETQIEEQSKKYDNRALKKPNKLSSEEEKKRKEQNKYKILNNLFYYLSRNQIQITKDTIKGNIEQLPLMCLKFLGNFLSKVFIGQTFTWLQFLSQINNKSCVPNKQSLINIYDKWLNRQKYKEQTTEETNYNQKI